LSRSRNSFVSPKQRRDRSRMLRGISRRHSECRKPHGAAGAGVDELNTPPCRDKPHGPGRVSPADDECHSVEYRVERTHLIRQSLKRVAIALDFVPAQMAVYDGQVRTSSPGRQTELVEENCRSRARYARIKRLAQRDSDFGVVESRHGPLLGDRCQDRRFLGKQ